MHKLLTLAGWAVFAQAALATFAAVAVGAGQWAGFMAPHPAVPPQSLVVGGLFLGIPITALGWGMVWFGRMLADRR